jgi:hypothetical protein
MAKSRDYKEKGLTPLRPRLGRSLSGNLRGIHIWASVLNAFAFLRRDMALDLAARGSWRLAAGHDRLIGEACYIRFKTCPNEGGSKTIRMQNWVTIGLHRF